VALTGNRTAAAAWQPATIIARATATKMPYTDHCRCCVTSSL
jgi:hypothetical protein